MPIEYQAYLIRFQRSNGQTHWRVRLENVVSGEIRHFATERELLHYLMASLARERPDDEGREITCNSS